MKRGKEVNSILKFRITSFPRTRNTELKDKKYKLKKLTGHFEIDNYVSELH